MCYIVQIIRLSPGNIIYTLYRSYRSPGVCLPRKTQIINRDLICLLCRLYGFFSVRKTPARCTGGHRELEECHDTKRFLLVIFLIRLACTITCIYLSTDVLRVFRAPSYLSDSTGVRSRDIVPPWKWRFTIFALEASLKIGSEDWCEGRSQAHRPGRCRHTPVLM